MKRRKRIPLVLAAGILMLAAGLIGLQSVPEAEQYAFLPAEEKAASGSLSGSFPVPHPGSYRTGSWDSLPEAP